MKLEIFNNDEVVCVKEFSNQEDLDSFVNVWATENSYDPKINRVQLSGEFTPDYRELRRAAYAKEIDHLVNEAVLESLLGLPTKSQELLIKREAIRRLFPKPE